MQRDFQSEAKVFKALCDPKRLAILQQLRSGEKCACVLQEPLNLTQPGLSYHMKILCDCGLVSARKEGKWTHYSISEETLTSFQTFIAQLNCQKGGGCACQ